MTNTLYYVGNLVVLRAHVGTESVERICPDSPFNSNATHNAIATSAGRREMIIANSDQQTLEQANANVRRAKEHRVALDDAVRALEQQGAEATAWLEEGKEEAERDRVAQVLEEEADAVEKEEQVVSRGIDSLSRFIDRGIESGEFKPTPLRDYPQPLIAPVLTAIFWRQLFEWHHHLDTDALLRTNIELTDPIRAPGREPVESGKGEER